MRFKIGQKIICMKKTPWRIPISGNVGHGPLHLEEVTVSGYNPIYPTGVILREYPMNSQGYEEHNFEPLMDITELTEILESVPESV